MQQNGKIDGKFKVVNHIYDDKNFAEDPSKFILKLAPINFIFQRNQSILHQMILTMKVLLMIIMATSYPIKVPMTMLISMIQIKLYLITKLLSIAQSSICQIKSLLLEILTLKVATV